MTAPNGGPSRRRGPRGDVLLMTGTTKGAFLFWSDTVRRRWRLDGPHFPDSLGTYGLYFGTRNGKLFTSLDEGESWRSLADHLPPITCVRVAAIGG